MPSPFKPGILRLGSAAQLTRAAGPGPYRELNSPRYWSPE